jgi:hypothetical protein
MTSKRAVAPVIATLLLVAIAVVGGSIIFVFSQGFFSSAQISGSPQIESIKILGYDATDGGVMAFHDGVLTNSTNLAGNAISDGLRAGEYVAVYVKNDSVNKVTFSEIRLAGTVYDYIELSVTPPTPLPTYSTTAGPDCIASTATNLACQEYTIVIQGKFGTTFGMVADTAAPELQPGQEATIVLALDKDVKTGRDMQFKLTTSAGAVFVSTVNSGQQSG